jgi:hypothetical protein
MASLATDSSTQFLAVPARTASTARIAVLAVLCAMTALAPALLLVWMPLVLGVPHLANDIRFLVLPLPRRSLAVAVLAMLALVSLEAARLATGAHVLQLEAGVVAAWLLATLALDGPVRRRALGVALFASALIVGMPVAFVAIAALAHNLVAIGAWIALARPGRRQAVTTAIAIAVATLVVALVGPDLAAASGGDASPWLTIDKAAHVMFGWLPQVPARALLLAFTFLQGVHYAIWLAWIPAGRPALTRSGLGLAAVVLGTLVVVGAAVLVGPAWARTTYLALATFHIYLELVVLFAWLARRRAA